MFVKVIGHNMPACFGGHSVGLLCVVRSATTVKQGRNG